MPDLSSSSLRTEFLRSELHEILRSPEFVRSPVMSKLVEYLVEQSIVDPANPPKAYHVAVEGLGKSEDFDVQADSYPRVQVGRLRKMLAAYYASAGTEQRLTIPMGSYGVEFDAELLDSETADDTPDVEKPDSGVLAASAMQNNSGIVQPPFVSRSAIIIALFLAALVIFPILSTQIFGSDDEKTELAGKFATPPKLYIGKIVADGSESTEQLARLARTHMVRSFQPFHTIRLSSETVSEDYDGSGEAAYRVDGTLVDNGDGSRLTLQLTSLDREELVWTRDIEFATGRKSMEAALAPAISKVASIYGVIPDDQRENMSPKDRLGYACVLRFDEYRRVRDPEMLVAVENCIADSLEIEPLEPNLLSAASFLQFIGTDLSKTKSNKELGNELAVKAMVRGKTNAIANFGIARASFFMGNCDRGVEYAQRAININPLGHDILVNAGSYMFACGKPEAEWHLQRAIELDPDGPISQYTAMVFLKMEQGKNDEALAVAESIVPPIGRVEPYYDLAMAMVYAHDGQLGEAKTAWGRLEQTFGTSGNETPEQILGKFITSKPIISRGLKLLRAKKVVLMDQFGNPIAVQELSRPRTG